MPVAVQVVAFCLGAATSLATSYLLVTRLERIGERLGLSEALLGMVAALAADAPEITSAVSALAQHQQKVGAGVIIGSNVFNLAALLGLGALVAGRIATAPQGGATGRVRWALGGRGLPGHHDWHGPARRRAGRGARRRCSPYLVAARRGPGPARPPAGRPALGRLAGRGHPEEEQELEEVIHPPHGRRPGRGDRRGGAARSWWRPAC